MITSRDGAGSTDEVSSRNETTSRDERFQRTAVVGVPMEQRMKTSKVLSLSQIAEKQIIAQLKKAINDPQATANYCCGGTIPTSLPVEETGPRIAVSGDRTSPAISPPVIIRWDDPTDDTFALKIRFPLPGKSNSSAIEALFEARQETAGFDRAKFSVDFNHYDHGVIDAISQVLLPDFQGSVLGNRKEHRGLMAELVRLNVSPQMNAIF
jgi:hypothetical protein